MTRQTIPGRCSQLFYYTASALAPASIRSVSTVIIDIESKQCPCCGGALHVIGEDRSEMLDQVPAQLRVKVVCRPRYACRACEGAVVQAPAPERPIDGGMATEALVAHVVVSKFCELTPTPPPGADDQAPGHHTGSFDAECLGGTCLLVADAAL